MSILRIASSAMLVTLAYAAGAGLAAQEPALDSGYVEAHYLKRELRIPMRDGVGLFTAIYTPRDTSRAYPILMVRTPYSVRPYGEEAYPAFLGPNPAYTRDGFIFVYQDVRGRLMSEGTFRDMTPHVARKEGVADIDESTDTWDTIDWLLENVPGHSGRVGQWGISYPGFYAAAGMIDHHPALVAVSPQAPVADWWYDDFHHHGAFFLPHFFGFFWFFGQPRPEPTTEGPPELDYGTVDGYRFYQDLGPLGNIERWYRGRVAFWDSVVAHPDYDAFWQARNLLPHLRNVAPAVLVVGGHFDAEDLYGAWQTYRAIEHQNPQVDNRLVMGPWFHGGWTRSDGESLGDAWFAHKTSVFYRDSLELPFFRHHLKDAADPGLAEATVFETGANRWRRFDAWPPRDLGERSLRLLPGGGLGWTPGAEASPGEGDAACAPCWDEFVSDPARPVPYTREVALGMTREYMTEDQRFAARRPDVLVYRTEPLAEDITLAGPVTADLWVSTSGADADWVVKLIDEYPGDHPDFPGLARGQRTGGYQMMVRSEVLRGRFRDGPDAPQPFEPGVPTRVTVPLQDVLHTFRAGHRIMIQVQSTWFPLVDLNPQSWVPNIYRAEASDFQRATHRVYFSPDHASRIVVGVLPPGAP